MTTEMRTMSSTATATKPGAAGGKGADAAEEGKGTKGGRKKLLLLVALVLVLGGAAAWWFLLRPTSADAAAEPKEAPPELGAVVAVDPISINLADGHYLKIGLALQQTEAVTESVDGSRALDTAIGLYSGKPMAELSDPARRDALKKQLVQEVSHDYPDEVVDVYFTSYVMQ